METLQRVASQNETSQSGLDSQLKSLDPSECFDPKMTAVGAPETLLGNQLRQNSGHLIHRKTKGSAAHDLARAMGPHRLILSDGSVRVNSPS